MDHDRGSFWSVVFFWNIPVCIIQNSDFIPIEYFSVLIFSVRLCYGKWIIIFRCYFRSSKSVAFTLLMNLIQWECIGRTPDEITDKDDIWSTCKCWKRYKYSIEKRVITWKQCNHFLLSDLWPPTSMSVNFRARYEKIVSTIPVVFILVRRMSWKELENWLK